MTANMLLSGTLCLAIVVIIVLTIMWMRQRAGLAQLIALHESYRAKVESLRLPHVVFGELGNFSEPDPDYPKMHGFVPSRDGCYLPVDVGGHPEALYIVARIKDGGPPPQYLKQIITLLRTLSA